jgi:hypothetical protein
MAGEAGLEPATCGFGDRCSSLLSYSPFQCSFRSLSRDRPSSLHFFMKRVLTAELAVLVDLEPLGLQLLIPGAGVIALLAGRALQGDQFTHANLVSFSSPSPSFPRPRGEGIAGRAILLYSNISVTEPAPTVRPPSRIANRKPFSIATSVINEISRFTLSPGITISTPGSSFTDPVTSVVRK